MTLSKKNRVRIEPLELEDVYKMRHWEKHKSPLFEDYNFPEMTDEEAKGWYNFKAKKRSKKCFGIKNRKNILIGYLTIRNIKKLTKKSTLGIVIDPKYINQGYGTESLEVFLEYYFQNLNMKKLILQVAKFNERAIRCYDKCGFIIKDELYHVMENQKIDLNKELTNTEINNNFKIKWNKIYIGYYEMYITKELFYERTNKYIKTVNNSVDMWKSI